MTSIKKLEDLHEGLTLVYTKNDSIINIAKIEDDKIFLEGRENSISLGTIKRWYKIVEETNVEETNVEETNIEETNIEEPKVEENKVVEEKKDPETTENIFRLNLLNLSKELGYIERVAKRYNSFYIDKVNMFEIMGGKKVFKVYFNTKFLDSELLKRLDFVNKNVRGNQGQITVQTEDDFIRCKQLIKDVKEGF